MTRLMTILFDENQQSNFKEELVASITGNDPKVLTDVEVVKTQEGKTILIDKTTGEYTTAELIDKEVTLSETTKDDRDKSNLDIIIKKYNLNDGDIKKLVSLTSKNSVPKFKIKQDSPQNFSEEPSSKETSTISEVNEVSEKLIDAVAEKVLSKLDKSLITEETKKVDDKSKSPHAELLDELLFDDKSLNRSLNSKELLLQLYDTLSVVKNHLEDSKCHKNCKEKEDSSESVVGGLKDRKRFVNNLKSNRGTKFHDEEDSKDLLNRTDSLISKLSTKFHDEKDSKDLLNRTDSLISKLSTKFHDEEDSLESEEVEFDDSKKSRKKPSKPLEPPKELEKKLYATELRDVPDAIDSKSSEKLRDKLSKELFDEEIIEENTLVDESIPDVLEDESISTSSQNDLVYHSLLSKCKELNNQK